MSVTKQTSQTRGVAHVYSEYKMAAASALRLCGLEVSFEASKALRTLPTLDGFEQVLDEVLAHVLGKPATADSARSLARVTSLDTTTLGALFTGLGWIVRTCIRSSLKSKALHAELTDCRVHAPFVQPILDAVERG